jgi:hypothetical protein
MQEKNISIGFPQGYFMFWFVTTQTPNKVIVKLYDSGKTYFEDSKQSENINPPLSIGSQVLAKGDLKINIKVDVNTELVFTQNSYDIKTDTGVIVGKGWDMCVDDGTDDDYNDVSVSLVAWKSKG